MDSDQQQPSVVPRNHGGKACTNCARIKCKCVPRADGASCERCHRLNKACVPSTPVQRRGPKHRVASRSARLEEKLDNLVCLLRTQQNPIGPNHDYEVGDLLEHDDSESEEDPSPADTALTSTTASGDAYVCDPSVLEADESLQRFRNDMLPLLPYIHISPDTTARELQETYPFLWLNIMTVASRSAKRRNELSNQAKAIIIERVVAGGERSMDLLYGILTYVNWAHMFLMDKRFASLASQLAIAVLHDLGLQMLPPENPPQFPPVIHIPGLPQPPSRKDRTLEERRAVLGAFVITSIVSHSFRSADGLRWSPHLEEYLNYLAEHSTVPQDKVLVSQVRMQVIVNQARASLRNNRNMAIPPLFVDALRLKLDNSVGDSERSNVSLQSNPMISGLYHFTTLVIYESSISQSSTSANEPDLEKFETFQRCITSIKAWLDIFFSIRPEMYFTMPCGSFCQLFYVVVCLLRLTMVKDPSWDPTAAQKVVDPLPTLDRIIGTFERLKDTATLMSPDDGEDAALSLGVRKFQALKAAWQSELGSRGGENSATQEVDMIDLTQDLFVTSPMGFFGFDLLPGISGDATWF